MPWHRIEQYPNRAATAVRLAVRLNKKSPRCIITIPLPVASAAGFGIKDQVAVCYGTGAQDGFILITKDPSIRTTNTLTHSGKGKGASLIVQGAIPPTMTSVPTPGADTEHQITGDGLVIGIPPQFRGGVAEPPAAVKLSKPTKPEAPAAPSPAIEAEVARIVAPAAPPPPAPPRPAPVDEQTPAEPAAVVAAIEAAGIKVVEEPKPAAPTPAPALVAPAVPKTPAIAKTPEASMGSTPNPADVAFAATQRFTGTPEEITKAIKFLKSKGDSIIRLPDGTFMLGTKDYTAELLLARAARKAAMLGVAAQ